MKKSRVVIITVIATLLVVSVIGALIKGKGKASQKGKVVRLETAQQGELVEYISAPGEIEPKTNVEISAKVSARIIELPFQEGDTVTCGDPHATVPVPASILVRLDAKDLESRLISARASRAAQAAQVEVEKAKIAAQRATLAGLAVSLEQAQRDLKRKKGLLQSQDISQSAFDEVQCRVDELKAQYAAQKYSLESAELNLIVLRYNLEAADAGIAQAKEALSYTTITSPIDGVITRINAEVGEMVVTGTMNNPGTVIMQVADLSEMLLVAQVDEADIGKLKLAQHAAVRVQAFAEHKFKGTVDSIALTLEQIEQYDLPPDPAKIKDPRAKGYISKYGGVSWELDALPPDVLTTVLDEAIKDVVDLDMIEEVKKQEKIDKEVLTKIIEKL